MRIAVLMMLLALAPATLAPPAYAQMIDEITPESERALDRGLAWLARQQGPEGNWESNDLGLVAVGALAFLSAGHAPGRGKYGQTVEKALDFVMRNAKPSGLLNMADAQRDMYNHGLATFVLGQAHGMTNDARLSPVLDRALKLIADTQCNDGGWDYRAGRQQNGHDLSLAVMQAKALRSAMDSGLEVPPEVVELAIKSVREHYASQNGKNGIDDPTARVGPGQFTYSRGGGGATIAMAACGVVCMQEFGEYHDWRISKNIEVIRSAVDQTRSERGNGRLPFDAYTLYYVGQAVYQVGGPTWDHCYPQLRDRIVDSQVDDPKRPEMDGMWRGGERVGGKPGDLYATSVACFMLAMPNRYLPILQEAEVNEKDDKAAAKAP